MKVTLNEITVDQYCPEAQAFIENNPPLYKSLSGGFTNYTLYKVKGTYPDTKRVRTCQVKANSEEEAQKEAEEKHQLVAPYTIEILAALEPTDNQIAYARDLGFATGENWSREDVSCMIDRCLNKDFVPLNEAIADYATQNGARFSSYCTNSNVVRIALDLCRDDLSRKATLYLVCFCAYKNLPHKIIKDDKYVSQYIEMVKEDETLVNSLKRKNHNDFCFPLSHDTYLYKATAKYTENILGSPNPQSTDRGIQNLTQKPNIPASDELHSGTP